MRLLFSFAFLAINFNRNVAIPISDRFISSTRMSHDLVLDPFGARQFNNPQYTGTHVDFNEVEFENKVNGFYKENNFHLVDGYAPFW
jgi:hypothetical protein